MASPTGRAIRAELLDSAEVRIRRAGVNGFSYGDLAADVGIKAPSIHHHFRTKDDLVAEVAERYRVRFAERAERLGGTATARIEGYAELFGEAADDGPDVLVRRVGVRLGWGGGTLASGGVRVLRRPGELAPPLCGRRHGLGRVPRTMSMPMTSHR